MEYVKNMPQFFECPAMQAGLFTVSSLANGSFICSIIKPAFKLALNHCVKVLFNMGVLNFGCLFFKCPGASPKTHSSILPSRFLK